MRFTNRDIGYTIYARTEEAIRLWLSDRLMASGPDWKLRVPEGVWHAAESRNSSLSRDTCSDPLELLEETDIPHLSEIVLYRNGYRMYVPEGKVIRQEFEEHIKQFYELRIRIAHVKKHFSALDLELLRQVAADLAELCGLYGGTVQELNEALKRDNGSGIVSMPESFTIDDDVESTCIHNIPPSDYETDGGFVGRRDDFMKLRTLIRSDLDRIYTISGAGGVGKTALAHRLCRWISEEAKPRFDAIVWMSAKEEVLTLTGIEPIDPAIKNYEDVLDAILSAFDWENLDSLPLEQKEDDVAYVLGGTNKGILLVIDNLETIQDERIREFIKEIPRPNCVLITSRIGLGEIERRYPLREMNKTDSLQFIRTVAKEKGATSLAQVEDALLWDYAQRMSSYPLAMKWVIGQVALGRDINRVVSNLSESGSDIARFCFEHIYFNLLNESDRMLLCCLGASDAPLTRGVLTHLSNLGSERVDDSLVTLTTCSLVIPEQGKGEDGVIVTKYRLLPLTLGFVRSKLLTDSARRREIQARMELVHQRVAQARNAASKYRYALSELGPATVEERIAAAWAHKGYERHQIGDYEGAVEMFRRAVEIAPEFSRAYRNWAVVEGAEGFNERADELMEKATNLAPNDPTLWFVWGNALKRRGDLHGARVHFERALELAPDDGAVLGAIGEIEKRLGNYGEADSLLRKALEADGDDAGTRHRTIAFTCIADNLRRWAEALRGSDLKEARVKAEAAYESAHTAMVSAPEDDRAVDTFYEVCFQLGCIVIELSGLDEAMPYFKGILMDQSGRPKLKRIALLSRVVLGTKLIGCGRISEARKVFPATLAGQGVDRAIDRKDDESRLREALYGVRSRGTLQRTSGTFGFIRGSLTDEEYFVHCSDCIPRLSPDGFFRRTGSTVEFTSMETPKGLAAIAVVFLTK